MDLTTLMTLSALPATLVVLGGLLVFFWGAPEKARRRFLFYILGIALLTGLAILLGPRYWKTPYEQAKFYLSGLLLPVSVGILALVVLHLGQLRGLRRWQIALAALLLLALVWLGAVLWGDEAFSFYLVLGLALGLAAVWAGGRRGNGLLGAFLLLALVYLVLFNEPFLWRFNQWSTQPLLEPLRIVFGIGAYSFPVLEVALAAVLIQRALKPAPPKTVLPAAADQPAAIPPELPKHPYAWAPVLQLGMAVCLLGGLMYSIYWSSIWDQTSDGLGGIFLAQFGSMVGIGAGMLMAIFSSGRRRWVGLVFMVLVPVLLFQAFSRGWRVSYHAITEARATAIAAALARYHARTEAYPPELNALVPRDLLFVPQPVLLQGEAWCYQGRADAYRLGAVFREYFSTPLSIHIYASAGSPLAEPWPCDARLAELKLTHDSYFTEPPPPPELAERLPESELPVARQVLAPVVTDTNLVPGQWSPDGRYLIFGRGTSLQVLDVTQSLVCPEAGEMTMADNPRGSTVWLPDGKLLVIRPPGLLALLTPCGAAEPLPGGDAARFSQVIAADPQSGNVLLKAVEGFWILDGTTLALTPVEAVTPNPYELHWDNAAWLPGGKRLAISRLNGRDRSQGSTLYILDGQSGAVQLTLPRAEASDQSAPRVEWLAENELLFDGGGALRILDFSTNSPQEKNVMKDLLGLDLAYPDEISAMTSVVDRNGGGYTLVVRANHPRNQSLYLYFSATRQVQVYQPKMHSLLFFPDGQIQELPKFETVPTYQDEYELVWVGTDLPVRQLVVAGHTPRSYSSLYVEPVPGGKQVYFSSSQGVSLVNVSDGVLLAFWDLGGGLAYVTGPDNAAVDQRLVAVVEGVGLFIIPPAQVGEP